MSHLGRPKGKDKNYSLFPVYQYLKSIFHNRRIFFSDDSISNSSIRTSLEMKSKDIHLLENLRFYKEEKQGDINFAKQLSELADVYVNDAFGTAHRSHASTSIIASFFPN